MRPPMRLLEVCVDSLTSARNAIAGGADRLELCSALIAGGLTPDVHLLEQIREESDIPIRCLMRPRAGDFLYESHEIDLMVRQMKTLKAAGANGFVIGCLKPNGLLDKEAMAPLAEAAGDSGLTLHRCIDVSLGLGDTMLSAAELGIDTILTSGGAAHCLDGLEELELMLHLRKSLALDLDIMAGAGVNAGVIRTIRQKLPGIGTFHMSGKVSVPSRMEFRREGVPMGLPGLDEWHIPTTSREAVAAARAALDA